MTNFNTDKLEHYGTTYSRNIQLEFENQDLRSKLEQSEKFQRVFRQENK